LAELCAATSLFTDLGTGQPTEHGLRTCLVAMRLADALELDPAVRGDVFYVSLLRFLGCTADAAEMAALAGADEVQFLAGMAPVAMGSPREEIAKMIRLVGVGERWPRRLRTLARALTDSKGGERLLSAHCEVGARLATEMGLPDQVSSALEAAYARWDGRGVPAGLAGNDIPMSVRVSIVARDIELWARETGHDTARQILAQRRGHAYDPAVVDAALDVGVDGLCDLGDGLWQAVLDREPDAAWWVSGAPLRRALAALGDYADLKLPERAGHARRVARLASTVAGIADLDDGEAEVLVQAALVHDVGMVAVPVGVWRGVSRAGDTESELVRLHPHWSARVLGRCIALERVALVAGQHHERRDGSGYPFQLAGDLGRVSGLLACVVLFDELTAIGGRREEEAAAEMAALAGAGALDQRDVQAILEAAGFNAPPARVDRPAGLTEREVDVLGLLARGLTNRQIAAALSVSVKTVGAHIEHIYVKAGVRSRAAATLFAMQHDLVG
jgi:response regulator RpfG family c-di-GMP phosphodiesterase/DNA-binding CsgD family transcriptional regulator